jgi:hypothetical protein
MLFDTAPTREHDAWAGGPVRTHHNDEGDTWHTSQEGAQDYRDDDADTRESEARQKPVFPRKGDPFDAPNGGSKRELGRKGDDDHGYFRLDWDGNVDAGLTPAYLPETEGGKGRTNPMDAAAHADRQRGLKAAYGDKRARAFIAAKRTTSTGERFVVPAGTRILRAPMHGPAGYLRYWVDVTAREALANIDRERRGQERMISFEISRDMLAMWLQAHRAMVERGMLQDGGRTAIMQSVVAGIPDGGTVKFNRLYTQRDFVWFLRKVPNRFKRGTFGAFLRAIGK